MPLNPENTTGISVTNAITTNGGWCTPIYDTAPPSNPSTRLMDLLQDAYDAGEDPDLTFNDFLRHALANHTLTIEVDRG